MMPINRTFAPLQALVDELARCGLEHAVTCPGSRNAPLLLTLAAEPRIRTWSILDERSGGFFALGLAKASGRPVAITVTSGTAAANLMPAVAEAHEARVPLIVLTADRPPELRETGAGQAIDQLKLYGSAAKWFVEVGNHEPGAGTAAHFRTLGCRAYWTAAGGRPGAVHLNFSLREPLAPVPEEMDPEPWRGREDGRPWVRVHEPDRVAAPEAVAELAATMAGVERGVLVCGPTGEALAEPVARLAAAAGWPLLAEPTSGVRCGRHDRSAVIAHYDVLLRAERFARAHVPELVIRIGDTPTSKPLRTALAGARQVVIDPDGAWHEPTGRADTMIRGAAAATCAALADALGPGRGELDGEWLRSWREADATVPSALAAAPDPCEPKAYAALADAVKDGDTVWVGSSMAIRDVEAFFPSLGTDVRFLANRGANGIDGVVSSAAGACAASRTGRTFLLIGELSLLHDLGGLLAARRLELELTIVCVNNGGGGIFDFLPLAETADPGHYEEHVVTLSGVEPAAVAAIAGLEHTVARTPAEIVAAAGRPGLIEVPTDRLVNVEVHRAIYARVARSLEAS